ncbi:helix-turn-helix domain-containing protein [Marinospirillum sp.]|uniref:helix-turn-helix domain-containing protein n=1 Tax=Marinospirillum sp. TaxID=2183934 RepID=UPI0038511C81
MSDNFFRNLRCTLGLSVDDLAARSNMTRNQVLATEGAGLPPANSLIKAYSDILNIDFRILNIIFSKSTRKFFIFEAFRLFALNFLNGYLEIGLWMVSFNEEKK